jgi:hypothetical protein
LSISSREKSGRKTMLLYSSRKPEYTPNEDPMHTLKKKLTNGGSFNENPQANIDDEGEV